MEMLLVRLQDDSTASPYGEGDGDEDKVPLFVLLGVLLADEAVVMFISLIIVLFMVTHRLTWSW